jgi:hypothetical protein
MEDIRVRTLPKRNIGVTGFMSVEELRIVQDQFIQLFGQHKEAHKVNNSEPRLMAGILISSKTISGRLNKHPGRYPKPETWKGLFEEANHYNTLNLAHYSTDNPTRLVEECECLMEVAGLALHGFQLNIHWPDSSLIKELRNRYSELYILLQIGVKSLSDFVVVREGVFSRYNVDGLMNKLSEYDNCLDGVLLDPSGGKGQIFEANRFVPLVKAMMSIEGLGIGVAGGLSADTLSQVNDLAQVCPYLSIDAEGRLRNTEDDSLNLEKVNTYLGAAFDLFYPLT